jgi:hypothetical protein
MNPINTETNTIPREVAISYLTDPKFRNSGPFRKQLWAALDKPAYSFLTILRDASSGDYFYVGKKPMHPMERMTARCRSLHVGILQLVKWSRRAAMRTRFLLARQAKAKTIADQNILADHALAQAQLCAMLQGEIDRRTAKRL